MSEPTLTNSIQTRNSFDSKEKSSRISQSVFFRLIICFQIIAYGSYSILVHLCQQNQTIAFSSLTLNLLIELFKLILSLSALIYSKEIHLNQMNCCRVFRQSLPYSIPALLYFVNNNLAVHLQIQMDPTSYQILSNFKIFTTTILYRLIMKRTMMKQQWFGLVLLFLGGLSYSCGLMRNSSSKSKLDSDIDKHEMYIHPLGIPMIFVYCILSGLAGVYNEWILKRNYQESIHLQNIFIYIYGTVFNFIPILPLIIQTSSIQVNLLHGFSFYTWLIVFTQVFNGLFMSVVMKYSSNLVRLFIISFSLIVNAVLSLIVFHINLNVYFFISFLIMICALLLFHVS